jgi:protein transport protein SEC61 subunit gamma-like protein
MEEYNRTRWQKFKEFLRESKRVLKVTKKPNAEEFKTIVKASGLGMIVIGLIGFLIHFAKQLLFH